MMILRSLFFMSVSLLSSMALSDNLSPADAEALQKTMQVLTNPNERNQYLKENPEAQKTDQMARQLAGDGANLEKLYKISADVMASLTNKMKGDSSALQGMIENAQRNPEAFLKALPDDQRKMIQDLGIQLAPQQSPAP